MLHVPAKAGDKNVAFSVHGPVVLKACPTCNGIDKRLPYLREMSQLRGNEIDFSFENYWTQAHGQEPLEAAQFVLDNHGWLTLSGAFDTGKTYLLCATVNEGVKRGKLSIYLTMARLLDYLRETFKPDSEVSFAAFWENILRAEVLCLDECEKYHPTEWAQERVMILLDTRYRDWNSTTTILATNDINALPGYIKSRVMDHRFRQVATQGHVRPGLERT